jgi:TM2 domain-containing membrane protein YozV
VNTAGDSNPEGGARGRPGGCRSGRRLGATTGALVAILSARAAWAAEPAATGEGFVNLLLGLGLPGEAGLEARRLTFENGPDAITPQTAFRVGMALALDYRADEAVPFLTQAAAATDDPTRADRWELATGVVLLRTKAFPYAVHVFSRVEAFGADEPTRNFATRLRCIAEVLARDGAAARTCIHDLPAASAPHAGEVDDLLADLDIHARARGWVGAVLSALVPGLGQLTGGHPGDAFLALAVNGGFGTAVYFLLADGAVADASLLGLGLGLRYYLGNIHNGAEAWRAAAERRRTAASQRLIRLLGPAP